MITPTPVSDMVHQPNQTVNVEHVQEGIVNTHTDTHSVQTQTYRLPTHTNFSINQVSLI